MGSWKKGEIKLERVVTDVGEGASANGHGEHNGKGKGESASAIGHRGKRRRHPPTDQNTMQQHKQEDPR